MKKDSRRNAHGGAFTLIELMIVVTIVAILVLIAIPFYTWDKVATIMSEGVEGAGMLRDELRTYRSVRGAYTGAAYSATTNNISVGATDLCGRYFAPGDYVLTVTSASQYTITVGPPSLSPGTTSLKYQVNQDGSEAAGAGFYTTGQ